MIILLLKPAKRTGSDVVNLYIGRCIIIHSVGRLFSTAKRPGRCESYPMPPTTVALSSIAGFLRQQTHDICNHLNGLDLEAALLAETITDADGAEGVSRMRRQIRDLATELKALSGKVCAEEPQRAPIAARELFLIWQDQAAALGLDSIAWASALGDERINVDVAALGEVLRELLINAQQFTGTAGPTAMADLRGGQIEFELREAKREPVDPSSWGRQPFVSTKRGGYGLGLWQAAQVVATNGGEITRAFLPNGTLVTKLTFPLA